MSVLLFCGYRTSIKQNCQIDLTVQIMLMVSHQTSCCTSSAVTKPAKYITGMVDHDCVAYSTTVEIFFTQ